MKIVDLHPEELLDKDARGALSEEERARLDAHLARCGTCRFERMVRADFAHERSEEIELSAHRLALLVDVGVRERPPAAETSAEAAPPRSATRPTEALGAASPASMTPRVKPSPVRVASFAAAVLLACGVLLAAKFGLDGWGRFSPGTGPSFDGPASAASSLAQAPAIPTIPAPVFSADDPALGLARNDPSESLAPPALLDDDAFFPVESFDERGDVLDEVWYPRAFESDIAPVLPPSEPPTRSPLIKDARQRVAPHAAPSHALPAPSSRLP